MARPKKWTDERIVAEIQRAQDEGRELNPAAVNRWSPKLYIGVQNNVEGGWPKALKMAGIDPRDVMKRAPNRRVTKTSAEGFDWLRPGDTVVPMIHVRSDSIYLSPIIVERSEYDHYALGLDRQSNRLAVVPDAEGPYDSRARRNDSRGRVIACRSLVNGLPRGQYEATWSDELNGWVIRYA